MKGLIALVAALALAAGAYWLGTRHAGGSVASPSAASPASDAKPARKLLYYRNPMGLPDTSPVPKKDSMGMDYIPVYAGEEEAPAAGRLRVPPERLQKLGVRVAPVERRTLDRVVRAAGRVEVDERRLTTIAPRYEGYVERLFVNATGQEVSRGQALFEVYSPEVVSAQREYVIASRGVRSLGEASPESRKAMAQLAESSLLRLRNWDVPAEQIAALEQSGEPKRTITYTSPVSGVVMERKATAGMRFMPGEMIYQLADLSRVWVVADVNEQEIGLARVGARADVRINAYPNRQFQGVVTYVYPTLTPETRTVPVRLELANAERILKPGMFAEVELAVGGRDRVLAVPSSALIDSGVRRVLIVQVADGLFEPRDVEVGERSSDWVEVKFGAKEGEKVVVAANFLIDAESNLRAALGGMGAGKGVAHAARGTLDGIGGGGQVTISHEPVPDLKWPAMTMDFILANPAVASGLKAGAAIDFEFVERKPGEWVITAMRPAGPARPTNAPSPAQHKGH